MSQVTINLSDEMSEYITLLVECGVYRDAADYLLAIADQDRLMHQGERIESALLESLKGGPPKPWTPEVMESILRRIERAGIAKE